MGKKKKAAQGCSTNLNTILDFLQQGSLWSDTQNFLSKGLLGHGILVLGQPTRS